MPETTTENKEETSVTETDTDSTPPTTGPTDTQEPKDEPKDELAHWKSIARKQEQRAKENAKKAQAFDELQEQNKTELQKAIERAEAAEAAAKDAEVARTRAEIAASKGVPVNLLHGETVEEITAAAEEALKWRGRPDFGGGKRGESVNGVKQWTRADLAGKSSAEINKAREAGRLDQILGRNSNQN